MAIIAFIIIFGLIVIVHEFGHYYFAKKSGVLVREFAVGFGPKIFNHHGGETTYTLRLLPMGGYVRLAGAEEEAELQPGMPVTLSLDENDKVVLINTSEEENRGSGLPVEISSFDLVHDMYIEGYTPGQEGLVRYEVLKTAKVIEQDGTQVQVAPIERQIQSAPVPNRILVNFAGPLNNFILAVLVFIALAFAQGGVPVNEPVLGQIQENTPAAQADLQEGDRILQIDGQAVESWSELQETVAQHPGEEISLVLEREGQEETVAVTPAAIELEEVEESIGQLGVMPPMDNSIGAKIAFGFKETYNIMIGIIDALKQMVTGQFSLNNLGGPVAIYALTDNAVQQGLTSLLFFTGYLSVNLGIVNLLPIPALDGGKIIFNIIEGIRGKPVSQSVETWVTLIGVGLIFALMIAVTWNDIQRFFF